MVVSSFGTHLPLWYWILYAVVFPLQGFFNAIVYFRRPYVADRAKCRRRQQRDRQQQPENTSLGNSRFASLCRVLDLPEPRMRSVSFTGLLGSRFRKTGNVSTTKASSGAAELSEHNKDQHEPKENIFDHQVGERVSSANNEGGVENA